MVWVITGQVENNETDAEASLPVDSSHYLRPCRTYRLGRLGYTTTATETKKGVPIKPRLLDFHLKTTQVSKDGAWDLKCEGDDWDENDNPADPRNGQPYPLTIHAIRRLTVHQGGEDKVIQQGSELWLEDGDIVYFSKYQFRVEWKPYVVCITSPIKSEKARYAKQAKALGIKLAYHTFLPHHTHLIVNRVQPSTNLCTAAMASALIASPAFLADLFQLATPPDRPPNIPPPPMLSASESADPDATKRHASAMAVWEQSLVKMRVDVGFDWRNWWGKCELERDWTQAPDGFEPDGRYKPPSEDFDLDVLAPDLGRRTLWRGVMVISFRRNSELDDCDRRVFELGGGLFLSCGSLDASATVTSLEGEIDAFRAANKGSAEVDRYAIIPPAQEWTMLEEPGELPEQGTLRELAQQLGVSSYLSQDGAEILQAVYEVKPDALFPAPPPPIFEVGATPQSVAGAAGGALTMPAPTSRTVVGATYPQSTAASLPNPASSQLEPATSQPGSSLAPAKKKLVRRGKQTQTASMDVDDDVWGPPSAQPDKTSTANNSQAAASATQVIDYPSSLPQTLNPPQTQKKGALKRRAGLVQPDGLSFLDNLAPDSSPLKKAKVAESVPESSEGERETARSKKAKTESPTQKRVEQSAPARRTADKRRVGRDHSSDEEQARPATKRAKTPARAMSESPPSTPPPTRAPPATAAQKRKAAKKLKQAKEEEQAQYLVVKTSKRTNATAQEIADDFNALHIVKPTLKYPKPSQSQKKTWKELDKEEEEERARLMQEDEDHLEHPEMWRAASQSMFVVKQLTQQDRGTANVPRTDLPLDPRWEGRPNFKKFRPKNQQQQVGIPRQSVIKVALGKLEPLPPTQDFGLGSKYESQTKRKKATKQAPAASGRKLGRVAEVNSDEDEDELMVLDEDDEDERSSTRKSQSSTLAGSSHSKGSTATGRKPKAREEVLVLDSDDSDSGLTFKGFGKSKRR